MGLAAEDRHAARTRIIDNALHQAGLADAGFPLDGQHRRPPLAELADGSRSQAELGLPPHEPPRRGHPQRPPTPTASTTPAPESSRRPAKTGQPGKPRRRATVAGNGDRGRQRADRCGQTRRSAQLVSAGRHRPGPCGPVRRPPRRHRELSPRPGSGSSPIEPGPSPHVKTASPSPLVHHRRDQSQPWAAPRYPPCVITLWSDGQVGWIYAQQSSGPIHQELQPS